MERFESLGLKTDALQRRRIQFCMRIALRSKVHLWFWFMAYDVQPPDPFFFCCSPLNLRFEGERVCSWSD